MKLLLFLGFLAGLYFYGLLHVTNIVLDQTKQLNATYQYVANNADKIAQGTPAAAAESGADSVNFVPQLHN